jgi:Putative  PD-(D/E)XK family member, (DUF4420)
VSIHWSEIDQSWNLLPEDAVDEGQLQVRELADVSLPAGIPLLAVDSQGMRHFLLPVASSFRVHQDRGSSGVQILSHSLVDNGSKRKFVDLICRKPHLHELFSIIVDEVLTRLGESADHPDLACHYVLERWRELIEQELSGHLELNTLVGLFGELWCLRELVRRDSGALLSWVGPSGARHDFVYNALALEVKSTLGRHGRFFEIHGVDQLEIPEGGQLYLVTVQLERQPGAGESITDLTKFLIEMGADRHRLLSLIAAAGVPPHDLEQAASEEFQVISQRVYRVDESFPRIIPASFAGGKLPNGVTHLGYQIDLSTEPPVPLGEEDVVRLYDAMAGVTGI